MILHVEHEWRRSHYTSCSEAWSRRLRCRGFTQMAMTRLQPRLPGAIVAFLESEYVTERLYKADAPEEIIEAVRAAEEVPVD